MEFSSRAKKKELKFSSDGCVLYRLRADQYRISEADATND
jgi:hypothetical protein